MEASDVGANVEGVKAPVILDPSPSVGPLSPPPKVPWGKLTLQKVIVSRSPCGLNPPAPKRNKVKVMSEKLRRSGRFCGGSTLSSTHPSSSEIIELDKEEAKATVMANQPPMTSRPRVVHGLLRDLVAMF